MCSRTDLLEHVLATNGSYYWVSKQYRMPWYVLHSLDVAAFCLLPPVGLLLLSIWAYRWSRTLRSAIKAKTA
jgi:lipopolysaccharide export LptBFGC system permease protein LptF